MVTVLLVEDDDALRALWVEVLQDAGYATVAARDTDAAWDAYVSRRPGVIVTDLSVDDKAPGRLFIERVRGHDPAARVIALSGDDPGLEMARALGAVHALRKPLWPREIVAAVRLTLREMRRAGGPGSPPRLGDLVRDKLSADALPRGVPIKTWMGYGQNEMCSACDQPILPAQTQCEIEMPDNARFPMHLGCHGLWLGELIRRSGARGRL